MLSSSSILKDSRKYNLPEPLAPSHAWTNKVKHISTLDAPRGTKPPVPRNDTDLAHNISAVSRFMDNDATESARQSKVSRISHTYFSSPIRTLSESIKDPGQRCMSTHDLVEAYNVLSTRMRSLIHDIISTDEPLPFLSTFKDQSSDIAQCLSRDIQRLLPSIFDSQPHQHSFMDQSYYSEVSMDDDDFQTIADNMTLCQYALRFASDIFVFPVVYSNFTDMQLTSLLRDVLSLCTTISPLIPNLHKGCAIVVWMLKVQRLPTSILYSVESTIVATLRNSISLEVGGSMGKLDAFKAIHFIMKQHPAFVHSFIELLPLVLDHLNAESLELRIHAALALSGFAVAKLKSNVAKPYPGQQVIEVVQTYLDVQTSRRKSADSENRLPSMFKASLTSEQFWKGYGPSFTLSVASCFLVLLDYFFFSSPRSLKLVFSALTYCAGHKRDNVRAIQPEIWRILIWVFSRFPTKTDLGISQEDVDALQDTRDRAYLVVRQEMRHGLGVALISSLLPTDNYGERASADVKKVLEMASDLINCDDAISRDDGVKVLGRLLANIGAPSPSPAEERREPDIPFAWTLVDGSLLSRSAREIHVPAIGADFQDLSPLSEEEVIGCWYDLRKAWVSAAQHRLSSGHDLSPDLLRVWQALLLVRGDLTQGYQHLTASPSFAPTVADIVTDFSISLETPDAQKRYLTFVGKLWTVLKNVFTTTWLSSPAESILAKFLKHQFTLTDDQVKELWSQLCADLISVGIPSMLHVLHVRSESQQEVEVTRHLWIVLSQNSPLTGADEDWIDLVHFLVMPFGVWDMSTSELELWEGILGKALKIGAKASQSRQAIISHLLGLCKTPKLESLMRAPRVLHSLLSHSLPASYSQVEPTLLSLIDESLLSCYQSEEENQKKQTVALDSLRLIGEIASKTGKSEIVAFLSAMETSLSCWIADEMEVLEADHHHEVVATLYKRPLEILSLVDPSISVLNSVATFIQSVFVHIRGDGPLAFHSFWRSTYHLRPEIPKGDYPAPIKACLKAWSDFCEDSIADGISLDSASQSLETFTIPDSQPYYSKPSLDLSLDVELYVVHDHTIGREIADGSSSHGTVTFIARNRTVSSLDIGLPEPVKDEGALRALQDYGGRHSENPESDGQISYSGSESKFASTSKRPAEADPPHTPKKRRIEVPRIDFKPRAGKERAREPSFSKRPKKGTLITSISEPATRASSVLAFPPPSASQPSQSRKRLEKNENSSWLSSDSRRQLLNADYEDVISTSLRAGSPPGMRSSDDYDTWEQGVSAEDLRQVQAELQEHPDFVVPDSEDNPDIGDKNTDTEAVSDKSDEDVLSPSLGDYPIRSRRRYRSQTAPEPFDGSHSNPIAHAQPLRRHQTSPVPPKKAMSVQLDALQRAYAAITDTGVSQVDVQEIMHARRLANQINQMLDEQMCSKFKQEIPET
ncbi:hypothetical protein BDZ97DRAFT_1915653 [Flammula alnicola]|nr:hypothetical protein BDZ97DRAFT_1915653 [Flammula alnicola]